MAATQITSEPITAVITTWLGGSHISGTMHCMYAFATLADGELALSDRKYSTPAGARRAARKRGYRVERYTAPGHDAAKRRLISAGQLSGAPDYDQELAWINSVADRI